MAKERGRLNLFNLGSVRLSSGKISSFKIDCDALTKEDLDCLAWLIVDRLPHRFSWVYGVPTGGERLAEALSVYEDPFAQRTLVVDDVWTTGRSLNEAMKLQKGHMAAVIFARSETPDWVISLFNMKG